ncbi:magnesium-translocating P-type ATPase [Leucobacter insecticola]|uniref:Magnesium-transporting ATPase, P-type 1 n=1 Tax=Leucobacter insecticola TaxID=2714934 RepID=A0A6G8FKX9_9MICO|nr:magnesium-translocating P-type ATPase [Leucobacter insecticola]QIM16732.1 magnesium-translocating P-type ATPase [Leucobacter insecticola]
MNTLNSTSGQTATAVLSSPPPRKGKKQRGRANQGEERRALLSDTQQTMLRDAALAAPETALSTMGGTIEGLTAVQVEERQERYGLNEVSHDKPAPAILQFLATFKNPFIVILMFLVTIMVFTDIIWADPEEGPEYTGVITISVMVLASAILRFWQEYRSSRSAEALKAMVRTTAAVTRSQKGVAVTRELPIEEIMPGDIIQLAAGDMIPADVRLLRSKDLQLNQAMLTGESLPTEKTPEPMLELDTKDLLDATNIGFMGTSVVSGSGTAVVLGTGSNSYFGSMASSLSSTRPETSFDKGIRNVTFLLIKFMLFMVPCVFIINGLTKDWTSAFLFAVTVAVGMTPEMLPLIVTANLAKGAQFMAKRKVIVKRLNSIQNFGAMDVLCTDKTGTLTEDRIVLERHLDLNGDTSEEILQLATANAHFQTGLRNLLDRAIIDAGAGSVLDRVLTDYELVDEMPFDFVRRRMSVVVSDAEQHLIITKGAAEEVMSVCTSERRGDEVRELTTERKLEINALIAENNKLGMRVLALATRSVRPIPERGTEADYFTSDERDMTLVGLLAFLDPPKASASDAIEKIQAYGTQVKVITGDNELVAATVCREVGIDVGTVVLGSAIDDLSMEELTELAERTTVFAKVNPLQKARIVEAIRAGDHVVGFLGDGINDAAALRTADVGISVDTAVDIAKESADIILLEKDLGVLEEGIIEGRRTFGNTIKYIKMTASSNFGNMFSVLVASAMLPFIPMIPLVVLVQNLSYDLSMLTVTWDKMDDEYLRKPRKWETKSLAQFMIRIGPISSIFDITTFALMWFIFQANTVGDASLFQSGWFIESLLSQTLIVHMIRTKKIPFIQSTAAWPVLVATSIVCVFGLILPFSGWGQSLGLVPLPWSYFPWLIGTLLAYMGLTQFLKVRFVKKFGTWL